MNEQWGRWTRSPLLICEARLIVIFKSIGSKNTTVSKSHYQVTRPISLNSMCMCAVGSNTPKKWCSYFKTWFLWHWQILISECFALQLKTMGCVGTNAKYVQLAWMEQSDLRDLLFWRFIQEQSWSKWRETSKQHLCNSVRSSSCQTFRFVPPSQQQS